MRKEISGSWGPRGRFPSPGGISVFTDDADEGTGQGPEDPVSGVSGQKPE